jgi:hypothetical protein
MCRVDVVVGRRYGQRQKVHGAWAGEARGLCLTEGDRDYGCEPLGGDMHAATLRVHGPAFVDSTWCYFAVVSMLVCCLHR